MERTSPSRHWFKVFRAEFDRHRGRPCNPPTMYAGPLLPFATGLYQQGYSAKQAGKLMAFLAVSEERGNLSAFDHFNKK